LLTFENEIIRHYQANRWRKASDLRENGAAVFVRSHAGHYS
jgi:hypothetical protein